MSIQSAVLEQQAKKQYNEGNYQAAYELLQDAISHIDIDEEDTELFEHAIDIAHEHLGLFEDVVNYANIILAQNVEHNRVRLQRAWANYDLGNHTSALDDFLYIIENAENEKDVLYARSGRGLCYYMSNHYEEAVVELTDALAYYRNWSVGYAHLGWASYYVKSYQTAREAFDQAIELSSDTYSFAHSGRGLTCYELYEYDQAIDDLTIGLTENENWMQGYATRAWCYLDIRFHQNQFDLALADFNKAISLETKDNPYTYAYAGRGIVYYETKQYQAAITDFEKSLTDNKNWLRGYAVYGWSLLEAGRYEDALEQLNYAIEHSKEGNYPFARAGRGIVNFELSNYEEMKADIEFALQENPNWVRGKAVLAWGMYELAKTTEEFTAALKIFDDALEKVTDYPFGFGGRGLTHYELHQYEKTIEDLDKSLTDDSKWSRGYAVRGWAKYFLAKNEMDYRAAKKDIDKAISLEEKPNMYSLSGRGFIQYKLANYEQAIADLEIALQHYTTWKSGYIFLANAYNASGNYEAAIKVYEKAIEQMPDEANLYHEKALLEEDHGEYSAAIIDYEKAIKLAPQSWMVGSLAELYLRGLGTEQDLLKAYGLFMQAYAMQIEKYDVDYFDAPLINCIHQELGVLASEQKIHEIIQLATEKNNQNSEFVVLLAYFYYNGIYVEKDTAKAKELIQKTAQDNPENPWGLFYDYVLNATEENREAKRDAVKAVLNNLTYGGYKKAEILAELAAKSPTLLYPMYEK